MVRSLCGLKALIKPRYPRAYVFSKRHPGHHRVFLFRTAIGIATGWLASTLVLPAYAATLINNSGIQFEQDTILESNFIESHGAYQSTFGVINLDTQEKTPLLVETRPADRVDSIFQPSTKIGDEGKPTDFLGTPGVTVPKSSRNFTFKAGARYAFYLESTYNGRPVGILYSNDILNPNQNRQVQFRGEAAELCAGGMTVAWDDTGSRLVRDSGQQDQDFDDFVVQLRQAACPIGGGEPPAVGSDVPAPPVAAVTSGGRRFAGEYLLGLLPLAFLSSGDDDGGGTTTGLPPGAGGLPPGGSRVPPGGGDDTTPIPEPITMLGSGVAIGMAGLMQRRRKQKQKNKSRD